MKEKDKYEKMKDNLKIEDEKYEIMKLSSINQRLKKIKIKNKEYK